MFLRAHGRKSMPVSLEALMFLCPYFLMSLCFRVSDKSQNSWDASPPLVLAFCGSETFTILQKLYIQSILHLTLTRCNSLIINTLLSVRCCQCHLHTTYTTYTLPHGTSMGGQYHGIGEQKSLLLRQVFLCPCGVTPTAYVQTDCTAAG